MKFLMAALVAISAILTGCANTATATFYPDKDFVSADIVYVERHEADERGINQLIADNVATRGWLATTGDKGEAPGNTTVLVTYIDKWMWDITMYMIDLTITLRDPETRSAFASGNSMHTSLTRKGPEEMVDEVVSNIIAADDKSE
jgi:hypothetical protein